jgi:hypothetical protein
MASVKIYKVFMYWSKTLGGKNENKIQSCGPGTRSGPSSIRLWLLRRLWFCVHLILLLHTHSLRQIWISLPVQNPPSLPDFEPAQPNRQWWGIDITAGSYEPTLMLNRQWCGFQEISHKIQRKKEKKSITRRGPTRQPHGFFIFSVIFHEKRALRGRRRSNPWPPAPHIRPLTTPPAHMFVISWDSRASRFIFI